MDSHDTFMIDDIEVGSAKVGRWNFITMVVQRAQYDRHNLLSTSDILCLSYVIEHQ